MWFWLVYLLTIASAPLFLLLGRPTRITTARTVIAPYTAGPVRGTSIVKAFRLSSLAPYIELRLWPWMRWVWRPRIIAFAFLGYVVSPEPLTERTRFHEAIHILQQASHPFLGPIGCGITYLFDLMQFAGWSALTSTATTRAALAERIAYTLDGRGRN